MNPKTIFLDFDGTYASRSQVPQEHISAVLSVRAAGHRVFLCTGRPPSMIPAGVLDPLDGAVATGGAYVELGQRVLFDEFLPLQLSDRIVEVLLDNHVSFFLESTDLLLGPPWVESHLQRLRELLRIPPGQSGGLDVEFSADLAGRSFSKVTVMDSPVPIVELVSQIGPGVDCLPSSVPGIPGERGEIFARGISKATGMAVLCAEIGVSQADVVAFGDGANDVEMLEWAGLAIAIEGSDPAALAVADRTTLGPDEVGIAGALKELGLN